MSFQPVLLILHIISFRFLVMIAINFAVVFLSISLVLSIPYNVGNDNLPLFHKGRPRNGFLGNPHVEKNVNFMAAEPQWFTQKLNHFDASDGRTWQQKYYVNGSSLGMRGPVFLMIGGEGPLGPLWVGVGSMVEYAKQYGALVLALEHRYYGESHPTE